MNIILLGSFAGNNAGDMVVLESIINDFHKFIVKGTGNAAFSLFNGMDHDKKLKLIVPALNHIGIDYIDRVIGNHICIEIIPIPIDKNPYNILKAIRKLIKEFSSADYIYTTAGILFDQKIWNPLYNFVMAYTPLLVYAKHVNPDVKIIGYNVGITSKSQTVGKFLLKKCVNLHDRIYLREERDQVLLKKLQYKGSAFISADNVFGYHEPVIQKDNGDKKKKMYINLTLYGVKDKKLFLREMSAFVNLMKHQYDIYFFQTSARDLQLAQMICKKTLLAQSHIYYLGLLGYDHIQDLLSKCDILVGMRMHSIIFALKRCCPVIAICYSPKVTSLMTTMHLEKLVVSINETTTEHLISKVNIIKSQREAVINQIYNETKRLYLVCNKYK